MSITAKHEAKRDFLLERGVPVLWEKGYNGVSVKDIVDAAGVPKGSFYNYFESKEDFVIKALEKYMQSFLDEALVSLEDESIPAKERIVGHYNFRVEVMLGSPEFENGCLACMMASEMSNQSEAIRQFLAYKETYAKGALIKVVQAAKDNGSIKNGLPAEDIINFIEDAWKGASITRKEYQNDEPLLNFLKGVENLLS